MRSSVLRMLAAVFVAGDPSVEQVNLRIIRTLRNPYRWIAPLAQRYVEAMAGKTRPRCRDVIRFLQHDEGFQRAWAKYGDEFSVAQWLTGPPGMQRFPLPLPGMSLPLIRLSRWRNGWPYGW